MIVIASLILGVLILGAIAAVGWYIVAPAVEWLSNRYFALTVKAVEAREVRAQVKAASLQEAA